MPDDAMPVVADIMEFIGVNLYFPDVSRIPPHIDLSEFLGRDPNTFYFDPDELENME